MLKFSLKKNDLEEQKFDTMEEDQVFVLEDGKLELLTVEDDTEEGIEDA